MNNKLKIGLYLGLILCYEIAKEELILNEEIIIIISFILSISLIYKLTSEGINETMSARSIELIALFEKVNKGNINILKNVKQMLNKIKQIKIGLLKKVSKGAALSKKIILQHKKGLQNKIIKLHEVFYNKIMFLKTSTLDSVK